MDDLYASLYEHVAAGVVRVRGGVVRYANPAVAGYVACSIGAPFNHPLLDEMTRAACRGLLPLPLRFEVAGANRPGIVDAVITSAPWYDNEVLVMFSRRPPPQEAEAPMAHFISRVAAETTRPMTRLILDLTAPGADPAAAARRAIHNAHALQRKLQKVRDLANLITASPPEGQERGHERMLLRSLVDKAIGDADALAVAREVKVRLAAPDSASPAVYGHQPWLSKAIEEYLEHMILSAASGAAVDISIHASGTLGLVRARTTATAAAASISLGLALARHIVQQHGGSIRIENEFGVTDVVLELPAGAPAQVDARITIEQATRYERSVPQLEARSSRRAVLRSSAIPADRSEQG